MSSIVYNFFFFSILFLIRFEKYQREIMGPSSPDSVPIIENKTSQKSGF